MPPKGKPLSISELQLAELNYLVRQNMTGTAIAKQMGLSLQTVCKYRRRVQETGSVYAKRTHTGQNARKMQPWAQEALIEYLTGKPDSTVNETQKYLADEHDLKVSTGTIYRAMLDLDWASKKRELEAAKEDASADAQADSQLAAEAGVQKDVPAQDAAAPAPADVPSTVPKPTDPTPELFLPSPAAWEAWLTAHADGIAGVWLHLAKKVPAAHHNPISTLTYPDALDSALCHGWIDGQRKAAPQVEGQPAGFFLQRFTPRRKGSIWSKRNVDRVGELETMGRMRERGHREVMDARRDGRWEAAYAGSKNIEMPDDLTEAIAKVDAERKAKKVKGTSAKTFFAGLNKTQRYGFLHRVVTAKKAETRKRLCEKFAGMLAEGKTL